MPPDPAHPNAGRSLRGYGEETMKIRTIALNTFKEAVRDRILYLLLFFAAVCIILSRSTSPNCLMLSIMEKVYSIP
jgi:hypothetical protein